MGLEVESCKFELAVSLLKEFVCNCVCSGSSLDEASTAIEVLQEIHRIHTSAITQLQQTLKEIQTDSTAPVDSEVKIKKEIPSLDSNDSFNLKENESYLEHDQITVDPEHLEDNFYEATMVSSNKQRKKNKKKDKLKEKSKKSKFNKFKDVKKHEIPNSSLIKNIFDDGDIIIKSEQTNDVENLKIKSSVNRVRVHRKRTKNSLTKTAKAKLKLDQKRQDRDEHYKLFGKKHICGICNKNFVIKIFLEKHMLREHSFPKMGTKWECDECGRFYASKRQLERHKMIHRGEKSFQCEICGRGFDTYDTRYIHQFVHTDNKYMCDHCGKVYRQRRHLVQHMKNHNGFIWKCKDCGKEFDSQRKWLYHKKNHSGNVKKKQCEICGAAFAASSSIRNHMMIHLGHKPYQCSQCDMSFIQAGGLRTHEKTHNNTSRSHRCELCGKMMTSKGLAYHLMVHEGSRPYKCDKCNKAFVTDHKLRKHKKIHLRLGHYKSEEEAGLSKTRRKSSACLPKAETTLQYPPVMLYPAEPDTLPPDSNVSYPTSGTVLLNSTHSGG